MMTDMSQVSLQTAEGQMCPKSMQQPAFCSCVKTRQLRDRSCMLNALSNAATHAEFCLHACSTGVVEVLLHLEAGCRPSQPLYVQLVS